MLAALMRRFLACLLLLAGCGSSKLESHRPEVLVRVDTLQALNELLKEIGSPPSNSVEVLSPPPSFPPCLGKENAIVIGAEDFADLTDISGRSRLVPLNPIGGLACWARKGVTPAGSKPDPDDYLDRVEKFLKLRYVLVVRTTTLVEPKGGARPGEFVGGSCQAEALLFDLERKKYLGGIAMEGRNYSEVSIPGGVGNVQEWLMENLRTTTFFGAREYFKKTFPDASPPFSK